MYESFFNLKLKPFDLTPNPDFIFLSRSHKRALTYLDYGIRERAGFILLTGDIGSGKTTIIRDILNNRYDRVVVAKLFNTRVSSEQLIAMINDEFGLNVHGKDRITLIRDLNAFLIEQFARGNQPVLIIDEAQNLGPDLLEEIRMLSNLETADRKLLQIILVGQPELRRTLADVSLLQLRQRISINCNLKPLDRDEMEQYIIHRLTVAGNPEAVEFSPEALDTVFQFSRGIPRLINIICDFLLLAAFAEETRLITPEMALDIVGDLDFENQYWAVDNDWGAILAPEQMHRQNDESRSIANLLQDISQRLSTLESVIPAAGDVQAKEMSYKLASLQNAFKYHVGETETLLTDLHRKVEQVRRAIPDDQKVKMTADMNERLRKLNS